ncbi:pro-interleukin-16 [Kryptolebias marmoratus]|uniref:Pro-interleukin-16-like n=1 Tax=Kryptolebias marmoratus TaxID=37003 RepID=A0A3Q2ZLI2_KRYMA|nr:pro-interleukin-16 [Kryptolebias marmoratus]XP_017280433.1 pro-interleukin-16 [Kryptolebias marmoratus]XP_017280434.1 pro-interleukin-16 [Kryptolebias marmoratus]XP_024863574.1 pro-interleukin-16 [Kryptolebias marmoratus]
MDLSVLPPTTSESQASSSGARFTVRSASSPSYALSCRSAVRRRELARGAGDKGVKEQSGDKQSGDKQSGDKQSGDKQSGDKQSGDKQSGDKQSGDKQSGDKQSGDKQSGDKGVKEKTGDKQSEDKAASGCRLTSEPNQNGTADKTTPENGVDVGVNSALERRSRTELRFSLPTRSQSFDWRSGARSPVQSPGTDSSLLQSKREPDLGKDAGGLEERRTETGIGTTGRGTPLPQNKSPANHSNLILDKASNFNSLPSRFRSEYGHGFRFTETSSGPKGGQGIRERIQKLYGSASETAGGTFPRRFSTGDNCGPVQTRGLSIWPQKDANAPRSETSVSPETVRPKEKPPVKQWHGSFSRKHSEEVKGFEGTTETGTRSLDRARSRNSVAAQLRSARTAAESENRTGHLRAQERNKEDGERATKLAEPGSVAADQDAPDTDPQKVTPPVRSSASVRNKINQFEALIQEATSQVQIPPWSQVHKGHDGLRKSRSAKEIREQGDKWDAIKEGGREERGREKGKKFGSERSISVDEVGLRLRRKETEGTDLAAKRKNVFSEDFDKYSKLKKAMQLPLTEGDLSKGSRPEDASEEKARTSAPSPHSDPVQPQGDVSSPVSDDDETPTNVPDSCSITFYFPAPPAQKAPCVAEDDGDKKASVVAHGDDTDSLPLSATSSHGSTSGVPDKTDETDFPPQLPAALSKNNKPDVFFPNVKTAYMKGRKQLVDLTSWVAGLNPEYQGWNEYVDRYEEDDDESTQKDDDSNYDSDSGDSSVTITSNKSQSDCRSFSLSLAELCSFSGSDWDSDTDDWEQHNRRSASLSSDMSTFSYVSLMPTEELDKLLEDVRGLGDDTLQEYDDIQVIVLHKEVGVGLGFSLAGGADQNKPITVHKVFSSGVAAQEGSIREGDQVLSINGTALSGNAHWEALRVLRRTKAKDMVVVVLRKGDALRKLGQQHDERAAQTPQEAGHRVRLQLQKSSSDLGFSLQGGVGSTEGNQPLTVQRIFQGGPVNKVLPGDEVLEINGVSVLGMRRMDVWTFIKKLPLGSVEVLLRRPQKQQQT